MQKSSIKILIATFLLFSISIGNEIYMEIPLSERPPISLEN